MLAVTLLPLPRAHAATTTYASQAALDSAVSSFAAKTTEDFSSVTAYTALSPPVDFDGFSLARSGSSGTYGYPYLMPNLQTSLYWNPAAPAVPGIRVSVDTFRGTEARFTFDPETVGFGFEYVDWNDQGSERSYLIVTTTVSTFEVHAPVDGSAQFLGVSVPEGEEILSARWVGNNTEEVVGAWNFETWTIKSLDLEVAATSPSSVAPGGVGAVELSVVNEGTADSTGTVVSYTPPTGVSIDVASLASGCTGPAAGPILCSLHDVAVGATSDLSIPISIPVATAEGTTFTGGALSVVANEVDDDGGTGVAPDIVAGPLESNLTTTIADPGAANGVAPGSSTVLNASVANGGPSSATNVTLVVTPPPLVDFTQGSLPPNCSADTPAAGSATCVLPTISAGSSSAIELPIDVDLTAAANAELSVAGSGATADNSDPDGDAATVMVSTGDLVSDLVLAIGDVGPVADGEQHVATVTLANDGPSPALSPTVVYTPPAGVALARDALDSLCAADSPQPESVTCTLADIAAGDDATIEIALLIGDGFAGGTGSAIATSANADPDGAAASHAVTVPAPGPTGSTISGSVFLDADRNARLGAGESDLTGVVVMLSGAGPDDELGTSDDEVVQTTTTKSPYIFTNVANGDYLISVDQSTIPVGLYSTTDNSVANTRRVTVDDTDITTAHFGTYYALLSGVVRSSDGTPLAGLELVVTDAAGTQFVTTTRSDGSFAIEGTDEAPLVRGSASITGTTNDGRVIRQDAVVSSVLGVTLEVVVADETGQLPVLAFTGTWSRSTLLFGLMLLAIGATLRNFAILAPAGNDSSSSRR